MSPPRLSVKSELSARDGMKPMERTNAANRWNQARGACLSPYRDLSRWQTKSGCAASTKPAVHFLLEHAVEKSARSGRACIWCRGH